MSFSVVEYIDSLVSAGVDEKQAKAMANGMEKLVNASHGHLVTKEHLESQISSLENRLIKWMIASVLALAIVLFAVIQMNTRTIGQRMTTLEQSMGQRMTTFEQSMDQRMTTFEKSMDQRMTTFEQSMDQRIIAIEKSISENRDLIKQNHALIQKLIDHQLQARPR